MKPCKGNYRVNKFKGCNTVDGYSRQFGLCPKCLYKWTQETSDGEEWFDKQTAYKREKKAKEYTSKRKKEDQKIRIAIMSNTKYWSSVLQPNINLIARLIDQGHKCIATDNFGKMNGGHYVAVGSNRTISLNLHNIFIQSFESNHFKSGDTLKFQVGIKKTFGDDYFEFVNSLGKCPALNITKIEMQEYNTLCKELIKELKKDPEKIRTPEERIAYRNYANTYLGIYTDEFSIYDKSKTTRR